MSQILETVAEAVRGTARANDVELTELQAERIARSAILATLRAIRDPFLTAAMCDLDAEQPAAAWPIVVDALIREVQA